MAISQMTKIMIVSHRNEAHALLDSLHDAGVVQILSAEQSMVTKEWPELITPGERLRDLEDEINKLEQSINFLETYQKDKLTTLFQPKIVVDSQNYNKVVNDNESFELLKKAQQIQSKVDEFKDYKENIEGRIALLKPWVTMTGNLEDLFSLETSVVSTGLVPAKYFAEISDELYKLGAVVRKVNEIDGLVACAVLCLNSAASQINKILRASEFDSVNLDSYKGSVASNIDQANIELSKVNKKLAELEDEAALTAQSILKLKILYDHLKNSLEKENTKKTLPATDHTLIYEGWVRKKDYSNIEKIVSSFSASCVSEIVPGEDEEIPVEIENNRLNKPFEVITRLYGMPQYFELDPTALLAPFFAIFFALCLTDAGYALIIIAASIYMISKMQGDKKMMWLLAVCSVITVLAGAMTGGWFGDACQQLAESFPESMGWLAQARLKFMWFDPLEKPMMFFAISCGLGYFQIMVGLFAAFIHNLAKRDFIAALCDQLTWIVMLNSIVIFGASKMGAPIPQEIGGIFGKAAIITAIAIFLFSQRDGSIGGRLGMGAYNLFSAIFYMGDVLSYLRLMALGMVTGGLAMAINVMAKTASDIPYVGIILAIIVLVGGHLFNIAISGLSAFVHTIRLQFVEFFPKFLVGGGREFIPLKKKYKHIYIKDTNKK